MDIQINGTGFKLTLIDSNINKYGVNSNENKGAHKIIYKKQNFFYHMSLPNF